LTTMAKMLALS